MIGGFSVKFAVLNGYSNILGVPHQLIFRDYQQALVGEIIKALETSTTSRVRQILCEVTEVTVTSMRDCHLGFVLPIWPPKRGDRGGSHEYA